MGVPYGGCQVALSRQVVQGSDGAKTADEKEETVGY